MSENPENSNKNQPIREHASGFLEKLGIRYYQYLTKKTGVSHLKDVPIDDLPPDDILCALATNTTHFAAIIAFAIGALTTVVSVWFEWKYAQNIETGWYYFYYGLIIISMLIIEMSVLFWLSLKTLHALVCLTGHHPSSNDPNELLKTDNFTNILARAALEIPDPVVHYLGIDPLKHAPKTKLLLFSLLYKAKVILSGLVVKFLLVRIFGKGGSRLGFTWIAIPITGLWDAYVMYKVAKESRLRLFGYRLAHHIADSVLQPSLIDQLSPIAREASIRAIATTMVLSQNYHPNMLILMVKLSDAFEIKKQDNYDHWGDFLDSLNQVETHERYFILDLLAISAAFDGKLSALEKEYLPQAFGQHTEIYLSRMKRLTEVLLNGRLHEAKTLCQLDFKPG
ncbi:MAG: hypothetical protein KAG26_01675 [Methylococcales bacterium]|nr:hypothetical protein [Methylococcales bacterium]